MQINLIASSCSVSNAVRTRSSSVGASANQLFLSFVKSSEMVSGVAIKEKGFYEFDSKPEDVLKKYDLNHMTEDVYREMEHELLLNENEESRKLGWNLVTQDMIENPNSYNHITDGQNMVHFTKGQTTNILDAVLEKYEQHTALHSPSAYQYKELYDTLQRLQPSAHPTNGTEVQEPLSRESPSASTVSQISRSKAAKGKEDILAASVDDDFWKQVFALWMSQLEDPEEKKKAEDEQKAVDRVENAVKSQPRPSLEDILKKLALAKENETVAPAEKLSLLQSEQNTLKNESTEAFLQMYTEMQKIRA